MKLRALIALAAAVAPFTAPLHASAQSDEASEGIVASFEETTIQLTDGWGEATACASDGVNTRCYRTEQELVAAALLKRRQELQGGTALQSTCATSTRLYSGTSYTGSTLYLSGSGVGYNLANYGWSNVPSSYKIGACAAGFYDSTSGAPPQYPGNTSAYVWSWSMVSGWNNRVSSVYIN